jgi:hypothetical protein
MAYKNLITYNSKVSQVSRDFYSPNALVSGKPLNTVYAFLSRVDPWADDNFPNQHTQDQQYMKSVLGNMFVAKKITSNDISPVIQRIDWISGTTYDYYQDNIDMFAVDTNGFLIYKFYVRNNYDQVFKCLWNNNGKLSTVMPMFEPGVFDSNDIYTGSDGYKWKFMYTIDAGSKSRFMDVNWMPIPVSANVSSNPVSTTAGFGDVEVINVTNGGSQYDSVNTTIVVSVTGTNTSPVAANVVVTNGEISDIIVSNSGKDYTTANITITAYTSSNLSIVSTTGSGATAIAPVSPVGGHAYDPISELGTNHSMFSINFNGSENGSIPTNIEYYQVGLVISPVAQSSNPANSSIYKISTDFFVAIGLGSFISDEVVYQGTSLERATFTATVLSFDNTTGIINLINTKGIPQVNASVYGNTSNTVRTLLSYNTPDFISYSGYISYVENRSGIQRSPDGIEQFRFVVQY